jgi:uncharacterized protein (DUF58 family)
VDFPANDYDRFEHEAHELASRMPALLVDAGRIANTLAHGIHGRKRHGPGETFWQFRPYESSDSAHNIDWRRSATSDRLFIREREWEASHTIWLWPDLSPSMSFMSHQASTRKSDRALVLTLAIGELLIRAGERIGLPDLMPPSNQHTAPQKLARNIAAHLEHPTFSTFPVSPQMKRFSECILFSDFLMPVKQITHMIAELSSRGIKGHLVQVLDPAEETLPYKGRVLFESMDKKLSVMAGRAQELRAEYQKRLALHRETIRQTARQHQFSFMVHHTDRPANEALLALYARLGPAMPGAGSYTSPTFKKETQEKAENIDASKEGATS